MDDLNRYLDLYRVGDDVQRRVASMSVGRETGFFNVPFPVMRSGLDGLCGFDAVGQPLGRPPAATMSDGYVAPPAVWLQKALNALADRGIGPGIRVAVDGDAGQQTLAATVALWDYWRQILSGRPPYLVTVNDPVAGVPIRTVAMKRDLLQWIVDQNLVEVAAAVPSPPSADPPLPTSPSGAADGILLLVAAFVAGAYFSR